MCVHENYKKLKMDFTAREYIDMIITYGMAGQNARAAVRLYAERFPRRERHPTYRTILRCIQRGAETGYLLPHRDNVHQYIIATKNEFCELSRTILETVCAMQLKRSVSRDTWCTVFYGRTNCIRIIISGCSNFCREMQNSVSTFVKVFLFNILY